MQKEISKCAVSYLIVYLMMLLVSPNIAAATNETNYHLSDCFEAIWPYWLWAIMGSLNEVWPCGLWALFAFGIYWGIKKGSIWKGVRSPLKDQAIMHVSLIGITTLPPILLGLGIIPYIGP
jgi:hypothetical protein